MRVREQQEKEARRLAADDRAGVYSEASARRARRQFVRSNWRKLAIMLVAGAAVAGLMGLIQHQPVWRGFMLGMLLTTTVAIVVGATIILSGSASLSMGAWAEHWTADELRPMTEHGYRLINHAGLGPGDMDHLLIGPGGVFLFETKWSSFPWQKAERDPYVARALEQVNRNGRHLELWLGRDRAPAVRRVIVLWGAAAKSLAHREAGMVRSPDGTLIVRGDAVRGWLHKQPRHVLTQDAVQQVWERMKEQVEGRDALEEPAPASLTAALEQASYAVMGACLSLVPPSWVASQGHYWLSLGAATAQALAALAIRRWPPARWAGTATLAVSSLWVVFLVGAFVAVLLW